MTQTKYKPNETRACNGGVQKIFKFDNGYSASVVRHSFSYGGASGLWELAVLHKGQIVYDTPITEDVLGHLTESDVQDNLAKIEALPSRTLPTSRKQRYD